MYLFQYLFICFAPANVIGSKKSPRTRYWQFFDFWLQLLQSSTNKYEQRKTEYGGFNINTFNCLFCWHLTINLILYSYFMQVEHDSKWVFYEYILISLKTIKVWCLKKLQCRRLETWSSSTVYSINEGIWMNLWTNTWLFYLEPVDAYESHESNPSVLHDLKLEVTSTDEGPALKVSWAVRVDGEIGQLKCIRNISVCSKSRNTANDMPVLFQFSASTSSLTGLWLEVSQRDPLWCQYSPPFNSFSIMDVDLVCFTG